MPACDAPTICLRPDEDRHAVAVVGDGAFSSGIVLEALNHAGGMKKKLIVVLNDNKMSICPRVGGLAESLDRIRTNSLYTGIKTEVQKMLVRMPVIGDPVERFLHQVKDAVKAGLVGGMLFQELGFNYHGPVDGHNIRHLQSYLNRAKQATGPVLLHVVTEKGHGFDPAVEDPVLFHTPGALLAEQRLVGLQEQHLAALHGRRPRYAAGRNAPRGLAGGRHHRGHVPGEHARADPRGVPRVASSTWAFASRTRSPWQSGMAKAGLRPVVDIYSTFLQRAYDQIFQEVALQDLPVTMLLDRAGVVGPDGPTHHGAFDLAYLRVFPNLVVMAPGDQYDLELMIPWALAHEHPTAIRYPKANAVRVAREPAAIEAGKAELVRPGPDGALIACGTTLVECVAAAEKLSEEGVELAVINARFVKPLDTRTILRAVREQPFVLTVEEGCLIGGFGSAVLEAANAAGLETSHIRRLGFPDQFIEHADRSELLADLGLTSEAIADTCRKLAGLETASARPASGTAVT